MYNKNSFLYRYTHKFIFSAVICVPVDLVQEYGTLASSVLLTVNSISVFCYIVVWITMAVRKTTNRNQSIPHPSFKLQSHTNYK